MIAKCLFVISALLGAANAGIVAPAYAAAPLAYGHPGLASPAVGSQAQSTYRTLDGNSVISQYSKAVDTAYSSVRKYDTRISNDGYAVAPVATAYHAPGHVVAAAPAYHSPIVAAAPAYHAPVVASPYAPAIASPYAPARAVAAAPGLLGVAYSAAPAVAHLSFDGYGTHYGW